MGVKADIKKDVESFLRIWFAFFSAELFGFFFLSLDFTQFKTVQLLPLGFGALWSIVLACMTLIMPQKLRRTVYGLTYLAAIVYVGMQTGYNLIFSEMMWLTEFRYASEGSDYAQVLLSFPALWWIGIFALILQGVLTCWRFPQLRVNTAKRLVAVILACAAMVFAYRLPGRLFQLDDWEEQSDYKRGESYEAAYENMFNVHRLYKICGLYQTLLKDVYTHEIKVRLPSYVHVQEQMRREISDYFSLEAEHRENDMTGVLEGKNVILILLESLDDWMVGEHTPTIQRMMDEGITFTNFYTPVYGGIRTFNSEFCMNTGSFLSSQGGYAFDYVTNSYGQSLASLLREKGYSALTFHFNSPNFYSRGDFTEAMGFEEYIWYGNYINWEDEYISRIVDVDDQLLFDSEGLNQLFFREGKPRFNFLITRGAHLPYRYSEESSQFAFEKYPEYYGMTGHEETDCALVQAKLLDDLFARLLQELKQKGELDNTVIIAVTDHYTYGFDDKEKLLELSGVDNMLLVEKTPCFIWSSDLEPMEVSKTLNTSDLLPTVLNLMGIDSPYDYIGSDAFDDRYNGFVPFSNGSWIAGDTAFDASTGELSSISGKKADISPEFKAYMDKKVQKFIDINNLILDTDYYQ